MVHLQSLQMSAAVRCSLSLHPAVGCRSITREGGEFGRGNFRGENCGFQMGAEIFPAKFFFSPPGPDLCLRGDKYQRGGGISHKCEQGTKI